MLFSFFLIAFVAVCSAQRRADDRRRFFGAIGNRYRGEIRNFMRKNYSGGMSNQYLDQYVGSKVEGVRTLPENVRRHFGSRNFIGRTANRQMRRENELMARLQDRKTLETSERGNRDAMRARFMRQSTIGYGGQARSFEERLASARAARQEREIIRAEADIPN